MTRNWRGIVVAVAAVLAVAHSVTAQPRRSSGQAKDEDNPIPAAVEVLLREYEESRGPNRTLPRKEADYFKNAASVPTPEQVFAVAERRFGPDLRADCYVKWQLLSGVPGAADDRSAARLAAWLRRAPAPLPNPLLDARGRMEFDQLRARSRTDQATAVDDAVRAAQDRHAEMNRPILGLRGALIERLPMSPARFVVALEELGSRVSAGVDVRNFRRQLVQDLTVWSQSASPEQLPQVVQAIDRVRNLRSSDFPRAVRVDGQVLTWSMTRVYADDKDALLQLSRSLGERTKIGR